MPDYIIIICFLDYLINMGIYSDIAIYIVNSAAMNYA
jgi:hypothetical protein